MSDPAIHDPAESHESAVEGTSTPQRDSDTAQTVMAQRIAYGILAISVILAVVLADVVVAQRLESIGGPIGALLRRGSVIPLAWLTLVLLGTAEMLRLLRAASIQPHARFVYLTTTFLILSPWLASAGWLGTRASQIEGLYWPLVGIGVAVIGAGGLSVARRNPVGSMRDAGATVLIISYLGLLGSFTIQMRAGHDISGYDGAWLLLVTLLVTKASDIGAFFVGSAFGRTKLIPSISPGKSIEGAIGGMIASALVAAGLTTAFMLVNIDGTQQANDEGSRLLSTLNDALAFLGGVFTHDGDLSIATGVGRAIVFGIALSLTGQIGDLVESCFKRDAGLKDSGHLIPRYGGILDLIDSPLFAVPTAWFLLTAVWSII